MSGTMWAASRNEKGKKTDSLQEFQDGNTTY